VVAWLWLVLGVALVVAEMFTTTFVLIMLAAGALAAAAAAALGAPLLLQALVFAVVSGAALAGLRPVIQRHLHASGNTTPIGLAAIEGSVVPVIERIDSDHGVIKIDGELWNARPLDVTQVIEPGERVRVIEIKGATALVWRE
jgi:membrane protein implicated in regulation of membrane protease activity